MPKLADRLGRVEVTAMVAMSQRAREMRAQGIDVLSLAIGEPDFATPAHAIEAAHAAAERGETKYPPVDGTRALKEAVQRKFAREHGLAVTLDQILVGNGGKQILFDALMAATDPGSEVLIPAPYWSSYASIARLAGGEPVFFSCPENNRFHLRAEDLEAALSPRSRWLILNFPNNPSGASCTGEELAAIAEVMRRHPEVWILSDDIYEHLLHDGGPATTLAAVAPDLADRILTLSGVSKSYAMTGWRIGFCAGPRDLIRAMANIQGQATAGVSTVGQAAAAAALDGPQALLAERGAIYRRRRDLVVARLNEARGITCHTPEGAFYVFPSIAGCIGRVSPAGRRIATDRDFAAALLEEAHVAVVHGGAFGMSPHLRISYASDEASLARACDRIAAFCQALA